MGYGVVLPLVFALNPIFDLMQLQAFSPLEKAEKLADFVELSQDLLQDCSLLAELSQEQLFEQVLLDLQDLLGLQAKQDLSDCSLFLRKCPELLSKVQILADHKGLGKKMSESG